MNGKHFPIVYSLFLSTQNLIAHFSVSFNCFNSPEWISAPYRVFIYNTRTAQYIQKTTQKPQFPFRNGKWKELKFNSTANSIINHETLAVVNDNSAFTIANGSETEFVFFFYFFCHQLIALISNAPIEFHIEVFLPRSFQKPDLNSNYLLYIWMFRLDFIRCYVHSNERKTLPMIKKNFSAPSNGFWFDGLDWIVVDLLCGSRNRNKTHSEWCSWIIYDNSIYILNFVCKERLYITHLAFWRPTTCRYILSFFWSQSWIQIFDLFNVQRTIWMDEIWDRIRIYSTCSFHLELNCIIIASTMNDDESSSFIVIDDA